MSVDKARNYLKQWHRDTDIIEITGSTATSVLAAEALGVDLGRIAKSMTIKKDNSGLLLITSGDSKIDNKKFKSVFGFTPRMLNADSAFNLIGYRVGGICPFDIPESVKVYLDITLKRYKSIYPACGSSNSMIQLTIDELETYSKFSAWVDVCIIPE